MQCTDMMLVIVANFVFIGESFITNAVLSVVEGALKLRDLTSRDLTTWYQIRS